MRLLRSKLGSARSLIGLLVLVAVGLAFLPCDLIPQGSLQVLPSLQLVPALRASILGIAYSTAILIVLLVLPLILGRLYCSVLCPLGLLQELVWRISPKKKKRAFSKQSRFDHLLRYGLFGGVVVTFILGYSFPLVFLDPYSQFGRFAHLLFNWANEDIAQILIAIVAGLLPLILIITAFWKGRYFCNQLCPVGTLLSLLSRFSLLRLELNSDSCVKCTHCLSQCSARCIDLKNGSIDQSRCVSCFGCYSACSHQGIRLKWHFPHLFKKRRKPIQSTTPEAPGTSTSRRQFMALAIAGIFLPRRNGEKTSSLFSDVVTPPGSTGVEHLLSACTGCQLCISHCPTGVLQASLFEYGLEGFMAPHLSFKNSGCSYDCKACSDSCPTGAIRPISLADKQRTRLGIPIRDSAKCSQQVEGKGCSTCIDSCPVGAWKQRKEGNLTWDDGCCSQCMNCVQVCPTQAISAVQKSTSSWKTIEINTEKCIGCGRCIQHCEGGALSFSKSTTNSRLPRLDGAICIGCGTCVANCPNQSLQMRALKKHEVARPSRFSHN